MSCEGDCRRPGDDVRHETLRHPGGVAVFAKVTGDYDKTGLPDPLELRFYFTLAGDAIAQLVVIPAKRH